MIQKYRLSNGIPVFIVETHFAPVVSIQAWVTRGSAHESNKLAGISHFLEHAVFKGTRKRKVGEIALEIESHGGEINAFTSFEETAYYATLASRYFEAGLDVIADTVQNPIFDLQEMNREREVILEEIRRTQDSPGRMVSNNLWANCFASTPYGRPVLGYDHSVKAISSEVLKQYFQKNYHAGTLSLFIVGDVNPADALKLAKNKFSRMKPGQNAPLSRRMPFPALRTPKVVAIGRDIKECHLQIGIPVPEITHPSIPALDLVCSAIGQGESSRLFQTLVKERQLALDVQMALSATSRCGIATLAMAVTPTNVEAAVEAAIAVLVEATRDGIDQSEIERVKNSLEAEVTGGKETVDGYARRLGYYYCQFGDTEYEKKYLENLLAVTLEDTSLQLRGLLEKKSVLSLAHPVSAPADNRQLAKILGSGKPHRQAKPSQFIPELSQHDSIHFVVKKAYHLPLVSVKLILPGGTFVEPEATQGIANLFQRVWTAGTRTHSSKQIAHTLESLGASIQGFSGRNTFGLEVECLTKHWPIVGPLLEDILTEPTFPEDEIRVEKELLLTEILSEKDSPGNTCQLNFLKTIYPDHPYGRSILGTAETAGRITRDDLEMFFKERVHRDGMVISSVGNLPSQDWVWDLRQLCQPLPQSGKSLPNTPDLAHANAPRVIVEQKEPLFQSHLMLGFLGCSFDDTERYSLKLLSACLAGQGGRLFLELRDKQSLAYSVAPIQWDAPFRGVFAFYIGCAPEKLPTAIKGIRDEIDKILSKPLAASELRRAKEYWIGRFELDLQRYSSQASLYGLDEFYGLGYSHYLKVPQIIKAISSEDIKMAANKYLAADAPTFSVVHNAPLNTDEVLEAWDGVS